MISRDNVTIISSTKQTYWTTAYAVRTTDGRVQVFKGDRKQYALVIPREEGDCREQIGCSSDGKFLVITQADGCTIKLDLQGVRKNMENK